MSEKAVSFDKHLADERAYYLGNTKNVPGSDKTIEEARAEYRKGVEAEELRMAERRQAVLDAKPPKTFTTSVTGGVVVTVARGEAPAPETNLFGDNNQAPESHEHTRESLDKLHVADLITIAREEKSHQVPDNMTKKNIISVILGEPLEQKEDDKPPA